MLPIETDISAIGFVVIVVVVHGSVIVTAVVNVLIKLPALIELVIVKGIAVPDAKVRSVDKIFSTLLLEESIVM